MKWLIVGCQVFAILSAGFIVMVQQKTIAYEDEDQELLFIQISIPVCLAILSLANQVGFTAVYQTAFEDDRIFPFNKRATSINIVILVSKSITVAAPFVNEMEEPIPVIVILCISIFILIIIFFFKSKSELDAMEKVKSDKVKME